MKDASIKELSLKANTIRQDIIRMLLEARSGHPGGALGLADLFSALYFRVMEHDPKNPSWDKRDRLVLSNGHVCPVLYASLAESGYFPKSGLQTLRKMGSPLQGHPHKGTVPGIENSSGPLGQGISMALGMAIVGKRENASYRVYCVAGDGELNEGQAWEAALLAPKYGLSNLTLFIDRNRIQIDGTTEEVLPLDPLGEKYRAFGWNVLEIEGNDMQAILDACAKARAASDKPTCVILNTVPGKGVSFMENKSGWHGKAPKAEEAEAAIKELQAIRAKLEAM